MSRSKRLREKNQEIKVKRSRAIPVGKFWSLLYLAIAVFGFAFVDWLISKLGYGGILPTFSNALQVNFGDYLHFSMTTISTLGYGDYRPDGFVRLSSGIEVITGFVIFAVFVSNVLSNRQERIAERILKGQLNEELKFFRDRINILAVELEKTANVRLEIVFKPFEKETLSRKIGEVRTVHSVIYELAAVVKGVTRYLRNEAKVVDFMDAMPKTMINRIVGTLQFILEALYLFSESKATAFDQDLIQQIRFIRDNSLVLALFIESNFESEEMANLLRDAAAKIATRYDFKKLVLKKNAIS